MTDPRDRQAFLLLFEEPAQADSATTYSVHSGTQTYTFVDREGADEDERSSPVAGTKTLTETREEDDLDPTTDGYAAIPRLAIRRQPTLSGTMTKGAGEGGGQDEDTDEAKGQLIPFAHAGTMTMGDGEGGATDEDESATALHTSPLARAKDRGAAVTLAGTITQERSGRGGTDADRHLSPTLTGTGTATKIGEEQDDDTVAPTFGAIPTQLS